MTATSVTLAGRAAAERLMTDACTITAANATQVYDDDPTSPTYDTYVTPAGVSRYAGACRVKPNGADRVVEAGAETVSLWPYTVAVPMSVASVEVDDVVTVTACALDPSLVGAVLRVRHVVQGSHVTARRLGCELVA